MEYAVVCIVALVASGLTLVSGFGLGTLLLPAFLFFFPAEQAVAMTGVVHFLNSLFKLALVGRQADAGVVLRFGVPAVPAALGGAAILVYASALEPVARYSLWGSERSILPVSLVMAVLIAAFAILEMSGKEEGLRLDRRWLPLGGVLSGFFGGLSGHQGALRSAFLLRAGLTRDAFIGTGVVVAALVDISRLTVYAGHAGAVGFGGNLPLVAAGVLAAFTGAFLGSRIVRAMTMRSVRLVVSVLLLLVAAGIGSGLISGSGGARKEDPMFTLTCTSYQDGRPIPPVHAHRSVAGGKNISPGFSWSDPPPGTKSFVLTIVDPHPVANNWLHWAVITIPFRERSIAEGASQSDRMPRGSKELKNSFRATGYGGPAPPPGSGEHPYVATLYALNVEALVVAADAPLSKLLREMEGKVIAEVSMTGTFERR